MCLNLLRSSRRQGLAEPTQSSILRTSPRNAPLHKAAITTQSYSALPNPTAIMHTVVYRLTPQYARTGGQAGKRRFRRLWRRRLDLGGGKTPFMRVNNPQINGIFPRLRLHLHKPEPAPKPPLTRLPPPRMPHKQASR